MKITEEDRDIITIDDNEYYIIQFISSEFAMASGLPLSDKNYNCILYNNKVFNLIIKKSYYQKAKYDAIRYSLLELKKMLLKESMSMRIKTNKIAINKTDIMLDKLDWDKLRSIIKDIFKDTNIEILICNNMKGGY